ncbi:MAG: helix-turn-helix domain-containing protein, partial [Bacteroidia bacterium]
YIMLLMSSNIQIPKICTFCKTPFIAKTTVTKFCSHDCSRKAWKYNKRNNKIESAQKEEFEKSVGIDYNAIQAKEYLSIKETCLLLGISRMSLHRYLKKKLIKSAELGGRIIIQRKSITNLLK